MFAAELHNATEDPLSPLLLKLLKDVERDASFRAPNGSAAWASLAAAEQEAGLDDLVKAICGSPALTERVLKVANSVSYTRNEPVSSVKRALALLGFDTVKSMALLLSPLESATDGPHQALLLRETARSTAVTALAREFALLANVDPERAAVQAVLCSLGRILIATRLPDQFRSIQREAARNMRSEGEQARCSLGMDFDKLAVKGAASWGMPPDIRAFLSQSNEQLDGTGLAAKTGQWFVDSYCSGHSSESPQVDALARAYARRTKCDVEHVRAAYNVGVAKFQQLAQTLGLPSDIADVLELADTDVSGTKRPWGKYRIAPAVAKDRVGRPVNFVEALQASIFDINDRAAKGEGPEQLATFVLNCFVEQGGYQRAALLVRDEEGRGWVTQDACGQNADALKMTLRIPVTEKLHLISAALERDAGMTIVDIQREQVQRSLPPWFSTRLKNVGCFVLLPMSSGGRVIAALYADRAHRNSLDTDTDLMLALSFRNSLALALRAAR